MIYQSWVDVYLMFCLLLAPIVLIIVWALIHFFWTPKEAKVITRASRKKKALIPISFDDGHTEFKIVKEIGDEGYIKTEDGWIGFLPRPVMSVAPGSTTSNPNPKSDNPDPKTNLLMTKIFTLKDAKIPVIYGYSGKAVLTNVKAIATLEHAENTKQQLAIPKIRGKNVIQPFTVKGKKVFANIFWPVDLRAIKSVFSKSWNQAQVRALEVKSELTGLNKGKKFFGQEGWKTTVMGVSIILALSILLIVVICIAPRVL